ncbi:MAG TPA: arsenic resistance N-acetyltransferase ArsN2 [Vicinamibacteria bacterium]|nr:arsenic resistance N-acetyltransferase ArsN2 [Vicinamibacteria bacterium]
MQLHAGPARPHDLRGALDLLGRSELTDQDVAERWGHYFVVREDDGRVVGVAGLEVHGEDGLLRSVAVDEDYRGQGLAASLVEAAMERAKRVSLRSVYLLTTNARDYFARHGFSDCPRDQAPAAIRESWEFRSGCPSTAAFMKRPVA